MASPILSKVKHHLNEFALRAFAIRHRKGKILIVHGKNSYSSSGAKRLLERRFSKNETIEWSAFSPNPRLEELLAGLAVARRVNPSLIVGAGGGTALDLAKMIAVFSSMAPGTELAFIQERKTPLKRDVELLLVPTTSGSGSEATHFAVVYIGEKKYSVSGRVLLPDFAYVDWKLCTSAPSVQKANSGIDALAQAIESLWSLKSSRRSRRYARHALRLISRSLVKYVTCGDADSAREMAQGSHLAGKAINISETTAAHALSYGITSKLNLPHGNAVALTLGPLIDHIEMGLSSLDSKARLRLSATLRRVRRELGFSPHLTATEEIQNLLSNLGLRESLSSAGLKSDKELEGLADAVNVERLNNTPVPLHRASILGMLQKSFT